MKISESKLNRIHASGCLGILTITLSLFAVTSVTSAAIVTDAFIQCVYDPAKGLANPLGEREFIIITHTDGNTRFSFQQLPELIVSTDSALTENSSSVVTVEINRKIIFYQTSIQQARDIMRTRDEYYFQLVGHQDTAGYVAYDDTLSCE